MKVLKRSTVIVAATLTPALLAQLNLLKLN
jgi:hypothetical protein